MDQSRGFGEYLIRWAGLHGGVDPRDRQLLRGWLLVAYRIARLMARMLVPPAAVTVLGLALSLLVPLLAQHGRAWAVGAAFLVGLVALCDTVDGALAVITNRVTRLGYVYDAVAARLEEVAFLVAFWSLGVPGPLAVCCGALSALHEYVRARSTAAGMREIGVVTVAERPTRIVLAVAGLALGGVTGLVNRSVAAGTVTVVVSVWIMAALIGLSQLTVAVHVRLADWPGLPEARRNPTDPDPTAEQRPQRQAAAD